MAATTEKGFLFQSAHTKQAYEGIWFSAPCGNTLPAHIADLGTGPCPLNTLRSLVQTPFQVLWGPVKGGKKPC